MKGVDCVCVCVCLAEPGEDGGEGEELTGGGEERCRGVPPAGERHLREEEPALPVLHVRLRPSRTDTHTLTPPPHLTRTCRQHCTLLAVPECLELFWTPILWTKEVPFHVHFSVVAHMIHTHPNPLRTQAHTPKPFKDAGTHTQTL